MNWKTLKIATVVALLASPSAFAAIPGPGAMDSTTSTVASTTDLQLVDNHRGRGHRGDRFQDRRPSEFRGGHRRGRFGHGRRNHYRWNRGRHFRGRPPQRRWFRNWRGRY